MTFIHVVTGKSSGILSDISSGILFGISSNILSGIPSGILFGISSNILSGISSGTLAYLLAFYLAVEVQRCTLSWEGPRLRSSSAHWAGKVPGWGPAVHTELGRSQVEVQRSTELGRSQVEVQRCPLSWEGPRLRSSGAHWAWMLAKSLAKSWQGNSGRGSGGRGGGGDAGGGGAGGAGGG